MKKPDFISLLYIFAITGFVIASSIILSWNIRDKRYETFAQSQTGIILKDHTVNETPEYYIAEAENYIATNRLQDAIRSYQFALNLSPNDKRVLESITKLELRIREYGSAKIHAEKLYGLDPNNGGLFALLQETKLKSAGTAEEIGLIFQETDNMMQKETNFRDELQLLRCISKVYLRDTEAINTTCSPDTKFGKTVIDQKNLFLTFKDSNTSYLTAMFSKTLMEEGYYSLAQYMLEPVVMTSNNYRDAYTLLGFSYLMQNKLELAKDSLNSAYRLDTTRSDIQYMLGMVYEQLGDSENALRYYTVALGNQYPKQDELRAKLASLHVQKQEYDKAMLHFTKLLETNVSSPEYFTTPVWIYLEILKDPLSAISYAKKARAMFPDSPITINLLGWAYLEQGDLEQAKTLLDLAVMKDGNYAPPYLNLGLYYEKKGDVNQAETYYSLAIQKDRSGSISIRAKEHLNNLP